MTTLTKAEAEQITQEILDSHKLTIELIIEAYTEKAHKALGYTSWDAYCADRLPDEIRYSREEVVRMKQAGLSGRAIASVARIPKSTVHDTLTRHMSENRAPDEEVKIAPVVGIDGKRYQPPPALQERRVKVAELASQGLSNVAIAERFGTTEASIRRDLKASGNVSAGAACKPIDGTGLIHIYVVPSEYAAEARTLLDSLKQLEEEYGKYHHLSGEQFNAWRKLVTALEVFEAEFLKDEPLPEGMIDFDKEEVK